MSKRRNHDAAFKARVALEARMAERTVSFEERLAFDELIATLVPHGEGDIRLTLPPNT